MLAVDRAENPLSFRHLQPPDRRSLFDRLELQGFVAGDDDRARNRWQIPCLPALLVVLDQFVNLFADDLPLIGFFARGDAPFEEIPVDFRRDRRSLFLAAANRLGALAITQDFKAHQLVDVVGGERGLVELNPELLHPDGGNVDHGGSLSPLFLSVSTAISNEVRQQNAQSYIVCAKVY